MLLLPKYSIINAFYYEFLNYCCIELHCHECYYSETNGIVDPNIVDNKMACYDNPWAVPLVNCADDRGPLESGFIYRCYTSAWKRVDADGEESKE